jgi:hypothetical protein
VQHTCPVFPTDAVPTARAIAQSIVRTGMLPSSIDVQAELRAVTDDPDAWGPTVGRLQPVREGVWAALVWCATYSWLVDETAPPFGMVAFSPMANAPVVLKRRHIRGLLAKDVDRTVSHSLGTSMAQHIEALFRNGEVLGGDVPLGLVQDAWLLGRLREFPDDDRLADDRLAFMAKETFSTRQLFARTSSLLAAGMRANVEPIMGPIRAARALAPPDATLEEVYELAIRGDRLLGKLTGLTIPASLSAHHALTRTSDRLDQSRSGVSFRNFVVDVWEPTRLVVDAEPSPHIEFAEPVLDMETRHLTRRGRPTEPTTVRELYEDEVANDASNHIVHSGCIADIPISARDTEPAVSALRLMYHRAAEIYAAADGWKFGTQFPSPDGLDDSQWHVTHGRAAFEGALQQHHEVRADLAKTPARRANLLEGCPYSGASRRRRTVRTSAERTATALEATSPLAEVTTDEARPSTADGPPSRPATRNRPPGGDLQL